MKTTQIRGNILVSLAVMLAGAAAGIAISFAAHAQVDTFGDRSEHGNPVDNRAYCVYSIERRGHDCEAIFGRDFVCAGCTRPANCPLYVFQNGFNATAGNNDPPCLVGLAGGGGDCETCEPGVGIVIPVNPL